MRSCLNGEGGAAYGYIPKLGGGEGRGAAKAARGRHFIRDGGGGGGGGGGPPPPPPPTSPQGYAGSGAAAKLSG